MGATDRWDVDAIENEAAWQESERAREDVAASELPLTPTPHTPTRAELEDVFRPLAPSPTKERDRRIAALTRTLARIEAETIIAQRAARVLTHYATTRPEYEDAAQDARARALMLLRYRDAMQEQLTALADGGLVQ